MKGRRRKAGVSRRYGRGGIDDVKEGQSWQPRKKRKWRRVEERQRHEAEF